MRCFSFALLLLVLSAEAENTAKDWVDIGWEAMRLSHFTEAAEDFQRAVDLEPANMAARYSLADAFIRQWAQSKDASFARHAGEVYQKILVARPDDVHAMRQIGWVDYQMALASGDGAENARLFDESRSWYEKMVAAKPRAFEAYYLLALLDSARIQRAGIGPDQTSLIADDQRRRALRETTAAWFADAETNLTRALDIDAQYIDAIELEGVLARRRAVVAASSEQYNRLIAEADDWAERADAVKKARNQAPAPVRVGANMQAAHLIRKVLPVYPMRAKKYGIQGTVLFQVIIGKDGYIKDLKLVSGHPELIDAAREAVQQWVYTPTMVNGQAVEVLTTIDVNFTLKRM